MRAAVVARNFLEGQDTHARRPHGIKTTLPTGRQVGQPSPAATETGRSRKYLGSARRRGSMRWRRPAAPERSGRQIFFPLSLSRAQAQPGFNSSSPSQRFSYPLLLSSSSHLRATRPLYTPPPSSATPPIFIRSPSNHQ
jgi:hypothetical protein